MKIDLSFHGCLDFFTDPNKLYIDIKISIIYCLSPVDKNRRYVVIFAHFPHRKLEKERSFSQHSLVSSFRCFGNNINNKKKAS